MWHAFIHAFCMLIVLAALEEVRLNNADSSVLRAFAVNILKTSFPEPSSIEVVMWVFLAIMHMMISQHRPRIGLYLSVMMKASASYVIGLILNDEDVFGLTMTYLQH